MVVIAKAGIGTYRNPQMSNDSIHGAPTEVQD